MATAPSPLRTTVGNLCPGSAPDCRGVWFPEDERPVPVPNPLADCGLSGTRRPTLDR